MSNFYTEVILKSPWFNSPNECRDLGLLEPHTRDAVQLIITDALNLDPPIRLIVTETFRSQKRQQALFAEGATELNGQTPATIGVHHFGLAADFCKVINGKTSYAGDWSFLRDLAEKNGLISGLDWGLPGARHDFVDPDHVQRVSRADQARLFEANWYPEDLYAPLKRA